MTRITKTIVFDTDRDAALLAWLDGQANASEAIREALRSHIAGAGITLAEVYQVVRGIERWLDRGIALEAGDAPAGDAPGTEAAAANLASLGL